MKIREVKFELEFEGSDQEYEAYVRIRPDNHSANHPSPAPSRAPSTETVNGSGTDSTPFDVISVSPERKFVTVDQTKRILTRRPLSDAVRKMIEQLYRAEQSRVPSSRIREVIGFGDANPSGADRFRGMMGAFGRRVAHDVGKGVAFFDQEWNLATNEFEWTLPSSVRLALDELCWFEL